MRLTLILPALLASLTGWTMARPPQGGSCEGLAAARLPNTTIVSVQRVDGAFTPPGSTIDYFESVVRSFGGGRTERAAALGDVRTFYRLYMAPGLSHCSGGPGPNTFDFQSALEQWVERGVAPDAVVATHSTNGAVDRSRPLCPYPQVALYAGTGSTDDAANFKCGDR